MSVTHAYLQYSKAWVVLKASTPAKLRAGARYITKIREVNSSPPHDNMLSGSLLSFPRLSSERRAFSRIYILPFEKCHVLYVDCNATPWALVNVGKPYLQVICTFHAPWVSSLSITCNKDIPLCLIATVPFNCPICDVTESVLAA
jgi:hypothetical protein